MTNLELDTIGTHRRNMPVLGLCYWLLVEVIRKLIPEGQGISMPDEGKERCRQEMRKNTCGIIISPVCRDARAKGQNRIRSKREGWFIRQELN